MWSFSLGAWGYDSRLNTIYDLLYGIKWKIATIQPDIKKRSDHLPF